jgi:uncharacterized membrane protein YdbT with pleckstrin-like domain
MDDHDRPSPEEPFDPSTIRRPHPSLLTYYVLVSALTVVGFPFLIVPLLIRYATLRYTFDDEGVSMSWGILFRREIVLTYRRIQDIHVTRNVIERWMGLAKVAIQTASGASDAEMTIEGIRRPELLRDHLYERMRGARDERGRARGPAPEGPDEALELLTEIRDELRALRAARERDHAL